MAINVKDKPFKAKGDGQTDDIGAFNAAHIALPPEGGTIIIPKGKYHLSQTWRITKSVILLGEVPPSTQGNDHGVWLYFDAGMTGIDLSSTGGADASTSQISNLFVSSKSNHTPKPIPPGPDGMPGMPLPEDGIVIGVHGVIIRNCAFTEFGRYGILVGDGSSSNNANGTLIETTRCVENGSDGFHLEATYGGCGASTFICLECSANKGWGYWHEGGAKNTFLTCLADQNAKGAFYEASNSTAWINCYSEGATCKLPLSDRFYAVDAYAGLFCLAGDYGAPKFTGGPSLRILGPSPKIVDQPKDVNPGAAALNSPANIIIAHARGYPTRLDASVALTLGRDETLSPGRPGALEIIGGSSATADWSLKGDPDRSIQIFNELSQRPALYITGGSDATAPPDPIGIGTNDRVGIGSTNPQAKLHIRPHVTPPNVQALEALRVDDNTGTPQLKVGAGVGFYGTAPVGQPTVSGSRGDPEGALRSLLTALATLKGLGLISDKTTP